MDLKLGKKPHVADERDLLLSRYLDTVKLPNPPESFSYAAVVESDKWGMLLNDRLGSCAPAEALHSQLVLAALGDHHPEFNDACCELAYQEMGGYVVGDPSTDQGCDLRDVARVWRKTGLPDTTGRRHRCGVYLWLEPGNVEELKLATYLFKAGCLGFRLTEDAREKSRVAMQEGRKPVWDFDPSSPEIGGHAVPVFGPSGQRYWDGVSWGAQVDIETAYIENQMDSGFVVLTHSDLDADGQVEGFDFEALKADMQVLADKYPIAA